MVPFSNSDYDSENENETWKEGPGCQPGIDKSAAAGPMDAGSTAVATTNVTISLTTDV